MKLGCLMCQRVDAEVRRTGFCATHLRALRSTRRTTGRTRALRANPTAGDPFYAKYQEWMQIFREGLRQFREGRGDHKAFAKDVTSLSTPQTELEMLGVVLLQWPKPDEWFRSEGPTLEQYLCFVYAAERYALAVGDREVAGVFRFLRSAPADTRPTLDGYLQSGGVSHMVLSDHELRHMPTEKQPKTPGTPTVYTRNKARDLHHTEWMVQRILEGNSNACLRFAHPMFWPLSEGRTENVYMDPEIVEDAAKEGRILDPLIYEVPKGTWFDMRDAITTLKGRDFAWRGDDSFGKIPIVYSRWLGAGVDLSNLDMSRKDLSFADLRKAVLQGADLFKTNLDKANLSGADLRDSNMILTTLNGADLSHANLGDAKLHEAVMREAILHYANLAGCMLLKADLTDADLTNANLRGADLRGVFLSSAIIHGADFTGATRNRGDLRIAGWYLDEERQLQQE